MDSMSKSVPDSAPSGADADAESLPVLHQAVRDHLIRYGGEFHPEFIIRARGSYIYDESGRAILDFTSGQMCATLGHNHPAIVAAIEKSCQEVLHLFSGMLSPAVAALGRRMAAMLPRGLSKLIFLNTGGESNETALRLAKKFTGGFEVVGLDGSWHGTTAGASSTTYASGRRGYGPSMPGTYAIPEPNCYRCPIRHCRDKCDMTCLDVGFNLFDAQSVGAPAAVIVEPILSAGGIIVPPDGYFVRMRKLCDARGMLLIFDEAQTAFGRIGRNFAFEGLSVTPDILTMSKTLGGGLPLSATATSPEIEEECYRKGFANYTSHVSDPLPATVGLAVLDVLESERLAANARAMGERLKNGLLELKARYEVIGDVRGQGLLIGVELVRDRESREPFHQLGLEVTQRCMELGLSMNIRQVPTRGSVWRIAPPLTVRADEIDRALAIIDQALADSVAKPASSLRAVL
jgi:2,2-dialkylglycine decarboxylase (pyruvate)